MIKCYIVEGVTKYNKFIIGVFDTLVQAKQAKQDNIPRNNQAEFNVRAYEINKDYFKP